MIDKKCIELLAKKQNLTEIFLTGDEVERIENNIYLVNGINAYDLNDEQYIIYDCGGIETQFDFLTYKKVLDEREGVAKPVVIFENWEEERSKYWKYFDTLKKAADKKEFTSYYEKKISIYRQLSETVILEIENDGINYLEYKVDAENSLEGFIYNISFYELKKLFNVTGRDLFRRNVRFGVENNPTGKELKRRFKEYISIYLHEEFVKKNTANITEEEKQKVEDCLEFIEDYNKYRHPKNFWFYHNGITIFSYDKKSMPRTGNTIRLTPAYVSVINGAQTMTNFFLEAELMERNLVNYLPEKKEIIKEKIEEAIKNIKVKTIIIQGDENFVQPITYGLNTQIPIQQEDIIAGQQEVQEINEVLKKGNMKILKPGESPVGQNGFTPLEFVKKFLVIEEMPGKSKNLSKRILEDEINRIHELLCEEKEKEKIQQYLIGIRNTLIIDQWWKENKMQSDESNPNIIAINKYGKNYFQSYATYKIKNEIDELVLNQMFENFTRDMIEASNNIELKLEDFKKDKLFEDFKEKIIQNKENLSSKILDKEDSKEICYEIKERLNKNIERKYTQSKVIAEYLTEQGINLVEYRVINMLNHKCKENFPFQSSTFSEICLTDEYKPFQDSKFKEQVLKEFPVFIVERSEEKEGGGVENVWFIGGFSFKEFEESAEEVYNKTIKAFEEGDETQFPKVSEKKYFHVRPKAANADDSFEFTNGEYITKRTFWANKDTVESIVSRACKEEQKD